MLESVRQAIDQSGSAMSTIDRLEHLERLKDKIREVMLEPDHWEQTPHRGGAENVLSEPSCFTETETETDGELDVTWSPLHLGRGRGVFAMESSTQPVGRGGCHSLAIVFFLILQSF